MLLVANAICILNDRFLKKSKYFEPKINTYTQSFQVSKSLSFFINLPFADNFGLIFFF